MKLGFRWYGEDDPIKIEYIRQIPNMYSIVTAIYDVPVGTVWSNESIANLKKRTEDAGLAFEVIESVPIHEDIKRGLPSRDKYIEAYKENIRRLGSAGIKCICYNFMPLLDWVRSRLDQPAQDGSTSLVYYKEDVDKMDPTKLSLPGWDVSYTAEEVAGLLKEYRELGTEGLWKNLQYFLEAVIPVAEQYDVRMANHADDPAWPLFGLPRILSNESDIDRLLALVDNKYNGLTFCTGSLGSAAANDVAYLADKYAAMGRIHFVHLRNVKRLGEESFEETAHSSNYGSLDMYAILKALYKNNFGGYIRPDHGRMIWGETGKPGYGLFDRALGASYINGIWEALSKE